jgi:hypothetical protein
MRAQLGDLIIYRGPTHWNIYEQLERGKRIVGSSRAGSYPSIIYGDSPPFQYAYGSKWEKLI